MRSTDKMRSEIDSMFRKLIDAIDKQDSEGVSIWINAIRTCFGTAVDFMEEVEKRIGKMEKKDESNQDLN